MHYREPEFVEVTPELRERLEKFREERAGDALGDVATTVLFEDDKVRIWEMTLAPGEWTDLHHHALDYYLVITSGDLIAGVPPADSGQDFFVGKIPRGGITVPVPKGGTEWAYNVGQQTYHEFLIELKQG
jgi:mannose-6-phosphate isomerase-like protein (cupin superfamily)